DDEGMSSRIEMPVLRRDRPLDAKSKATIVRPTRPNATSLIDCRRATARRRGPGSVGAAAAWGDRPAPLRPGHRIQRPKLASAAGPVVRATAAETITDTPSAGPSTRRNSRPATARLAALPATVNAATRMIGV